MRRIMLMTTGLMLSCSSAGAETIGDYVSYLNAQKKLNAELLLPVPLLAKDPDSGEEIRLVFPAGSSSAWPPACEEKALCFKSGTNNFTQMWCPDGEGKLQIDILFGTTRVDSNIKNCGDDEPGTCNDHCSGN